ncbi:hypothetical protein ACTFIV_006677 [Dictyostelium citrinum]
MSESPKVKKTTNTTTKTNQSSPSLWANVIYQINTQSRQLMKERISLSSPSQSSKRINKTIDNNGTSKQPIPMWRNNNRNNNNDDDYGFSNSGYDDNDDYDTQSENHSSIQTESIINSSPILSQDTPYKQKTNKKSTNLNNKNENENENESESESEYIEENENNSDSDTNSNFIGDSDYNDSNLFTREDSENENENDQIITTTTTEEINKNIRKPRKPRQSLSSKSGLVFPVSRVHSILKSNKFFQMKRISKDSVVYLTAVLQYLCEELLLLSIQYCIDTKKKRIGRRDILKSIELDNEYRLIFDNLIVNSDSF